MYAPYSDSTLRDRLVIAPVQRTDGSSPSRVIPQKAIERSRRHWSNWPSGVIKAIKRALGFEGQLEQVEADLDNAVAYIENVKVTSDYVARLEAVE